MTDIREVWIVVGEVTDPTLYENAVLGQKEYQFSDGPSGKRSMSSDYIELEEGLAAHTGYIIHWHDEGLLDD